jgi:hypothetical protein
MQLVEHVLAAAPPDDHVLNMLLLVLKPANKMTALLPAYEAACSKEPGNEELLQGLFACHVRWVPNVVAFCSITRLVLMLTTYMPLNAGHVTHIAPNCVQPYAGECV